MFARIRTKIRKYFLAGLMVIIPLYFTVYIIELILTLGDTVVAVLPKAFHPPDHLWFPGMGLIIAGLLTLLAGVLVRNVIGNWIYNYFNSLVERIPVIASLYSLFRQVSETFLGSNTSSFKRVVLVEWPRRDSWMLAFISAKTSGTIQKHLEGRTGASNYLNVFIPTTPNPTSGFYFMVKEDEVIDLAITVDQAFKTIVSGGTLSPEATMSQSTMFATTNPGATLLRRKTKQK